MPNRASELVWDKTKPAPGRKLNRDVVVGAAIALADHEGLDAVSVRRIATDLGVRPMSLYTHIATKDDLVRLMVDEVVSEIIIHEELPEDWRAALGRIAHSSHAALAAHPWMLQASTRSGMLGPNALRHAEQLIAAVAPLRLDPADAWAVAGIVNDYTLGHALRIAHPAADTEQRPYPTIDPAVFPHLARALHARTPDRDDATFTTGLDTVLDGIERRFARPGR
ncbi:TetR/AcrR family transcriptional regulator [Parafrankia sp. FMc2]|uniref:TetR/AcrR family transcriptional regulator n=1 Tax=Parafrankia sp. FMc2 TaxID=3233196 RepID=UPI0034D496D1